jgi:hypothetical protein
MGLCDVLLYGYLRLFANSVLQNAQAAYGKNRQIHSCYTAGYQKQNAITNSKCWKANQEIIHAKNGTIGREGITWRGAV